MGETLVVAWFLLLGVGLLFMVLMLGVDEIRLHRRLRREGVRLTGAVVRHQEERGSEDNTVYFAVVGFTDADGNQGEIQRTGSGTEKWPIGREVPVVHLPGAPSTARIDLPSEHRTNKGFPFAFVGMVLVSALAFLYSSSHE